MLAARNLNTYYGLSHILFDLSVELGDREIVCVLGRNGVGKTTLMRTIMGLTPPRQGSIQLNGEEVAGLRPYQLARRGLGFVPAERRIFIDLTVRQNLEIAVKPPVGRLGGQPWTIPDILEFFPILKKLENRLGSQLSGGEQQVLATARAVIGNPSHILMDEPSEGLSPLIVSELKDKLLALQGRGVSILLCEQNTKFAFKVSSRGYIMDKGRVLHQGPVDELQCRAEVRECLGV
ncbi:MAG: ABC transporter ATP-binding protein [Thermodesulfobacteriota bacterium]